MLSHIRLPRGTFSISPWPTKGTCISKLIIFAMGNFSLRFGNPWLQFFAWQHCKLQFYVFTWQTLIAVFTFLRGNPNCSFTWQPQIAALLKVYSPTTRSGLTLRDSRLKLPLHTLQVTVLANRPAVFPRWSLWSEHPLIWSTGNRRLLRRRNSPHGIGSDSNPGPLCP